MTHSVFYIQVHDDMVEYFNYIPLLRTFILFYFKRLTKAKHRKTIQVQLYVILEFFSTPLPSCLLLIIHSVYCILLCIFLVCLNDDRERVENLLQDKTTLMTPYSQQTHKYYAFTAGSAPFPFQPYAPSFKLAPPSPSSTLGVTSQTPLMVPVTRHPSTFKNGGIICTIQIVDVQSVLITYLSLTVCD